MKSIQKQAVFAFILGIFVLGGASSTQAKALRAGGGAITVDRSCYSVWSPGPTNNLLCCDDSQGKDNKQSCLDAGINCSHDPRSLDCVVFTIGCASNCTVEPVKN